MVTRSKADAGQTAAGRQKELELVMINMTNEWLKTMNHVGNIDVIYSLFHWRCLLQQTDNITTIYRVDQLE